MNQDTRTHWKKLTDPRFIGVYALPNEADDLTVEITQVTHEEIKMMGGKKEMHTLLHLKGHQPLMLNKTNSLSIERLYSPYIETWAGKKITLYASTTSFGKEKNVPCLRIRPQVMESKKSFIADERLQAAIVSIKAKTFTLEKLYEKFDLTIEQVKIVNESLEESHA
jgi:hypothetical protein